MRLVFLLSVSWIFLHVSGVHADSLEQLRADAAQADAQFQRLRQLSSDVVSEEEVERAALDVHLLRAKIARRLRRPSSEIPHLAQVVQIRKRLVDRNLRLAEEGAATKADLDRELVSLEMTRVRLAEIVGDTQAEIKALRRLLVVYHRQLTRAKELLEHRMSTKDELAIMESTIQRAHRRLSLAERRAARKEKAKRRPNESPVI